LAKSCKSHRFFSTVIFRHPVGFQVLDVFLGDPAEGVAGG
jgi:hypothetical protein